MKCIKPMEAFSSSYIHIFLYGRTKDGIWWKQKGADWWSGVHTFTGNILYLVTEGEFRLQINDHLYHVHAGDMVYIPANTTHERIICSELPLRIYHCSFDLSFGQNTLHHSFKIPYVTTVSDIETVTDLFNTLITNCKKGSHARATIGQNGALLLLLSILLEDSNSPLLLDDTRTERTMHAVSEFINANLHRTITVEELSRFAGYSHDHFVKIFKTFFGCLPLKYISDVKLEYAKKRLTETNLPISSIAEKLGFCDASYFGRFFKNKTGLSPLQYRKTVKHRI